MRTRKINLGWGNHAGNLPSLKSTGLIYLNHRYKKPSGFTVIEPPSWKFHLEDFEIVPTPSYGKMFSNY